MASTSNIRAFVQWKEASIFAGEEVECVITFRNMTDAADQGKEQWHEGDDQYQYQYQYHDHDPSRRLNVPAMRPRIERQRTVTQSTGVSRGQLSTAPSVMGTATATATGTGTGTSSRMPSFSRGHRPNLSLTVSPTPVPMSHARTPSVVSTTPHTGPRPPPRHGRSLSIMSLTSATSGPGLLHAKPSPAPSPRPGRGHGRSASMQVLSKSSAQQSPFAGFPSPRQPSPLYEFPNSNSSPNPNPNPNPPFALPWTNQEGFGQPFRPQRRRSGINTAPNTPAINLPQRTPSAALAAQSFTFPPPSASPVLPDQSPRFDFEFPPKNLRSTIKPAHQRSQEALGAPGSLNPITRVITDSSTNGTPRSSTDFYSFSNQSTDTIASEIPALANGRLLPKSLHTRQPPRSTPPTNHDPEPEALMMAYAQTMGSFTLDGSLVNQAPFEDVKRKGVVGGQAGGGVVGVERSKRESGIFGAFGWGSIGESIGGLLGGGEMSSIKEMRGVASTKSIPLLSTPQSILFVDLKLAPGESKSYTYRFQLPRGLPPTHKGRAIKVRYHIKIGVQRPGKLGGQQNIKHLEIPFRVLGSVNTRGETLGHDLMSPYILLHDRARTAIVDTPEDTSLVLPSFPSPENLASLPKPSSAGLDDFLTYTQSLLTKPPSGSSDPLLSPNSDPAQHRRRSSMDDPGPTSVKESIDLAILRSNISSSSNPDTGQPTSSQSNNRFTIARGGQFVAVLTILRPAYRLGETVIGVLDFTPPEPSTSTSSSPPSTASASASSSQNLPLRSPHQPQRHEQQQQKQYLPTYAVSLFLETSETVDPSLAMRSSSSISRVTRKTHASCAENVLFAQKTSFKLEIPVNGTPSFETTGVRLGWKLRVGFVCRKGLVPTPNLGMQGPSQENSNGYEHGEVDVGEFGLGISGVGGPEDDELFDPVEASVVATGGDEKKGRRESNSNGGGTPQELRRLQHQRRASQHSQKQQQKQRLRAPTPSIPVNDLLEEVHSDERGTVLLARERLGAESFEIEVPIKVFGSAAATATASGVDGRDGRSGDAPGGGMEI